MKYKVGKSSIQGKGLIVKEPFKEGELIGLAHINNQPTKVVGLHHNHSDEPTAGNIEVGNKRYLVALRNLKPGEEITTNYREQPELEQPEDFEKKKGGAVSMPTDKPEKSKKFSRSLDATNRLFTENNLFKRPKSRKNKVFDPKAKYYKKGGALLTKKVTCKKCGWEWDAADGGNDMTTCHKCGGQGLIHAQGGGDIDGMTAMMKARLAYADMHGNPAAKRMINIPDNPYEFDNGDTGTHYMASMDNYAVPQIQDENGILQLGDYGPESNEAIRFDSDEDANYFAENYKDVSPGFLNQKQQGGESGCPNNMIWDEATQSCVSANETTTEEVGFDPIDMWAEDYEQKNPRGSYVYDKKQEYLKKTNRGLSKLAGITLDNFPKEVEDQINEKYNYNMNGYITDRMAKVKKFNPKRRDEWIDELGPRSKEVVANSKYGSKLQPSLWSRSLAGLATLASSFSPDLQAEIKASLPGLTRKETNEIYNANYKGIPLGGLETFSAGDVFGAATANYLKNSKKDIPNIFSGELMSNVDATDAMAMNLMGVVGGIEGLAALGTKGVSLLGLTADALKPGAKYLSSINSIPTLNKPISPISFESVPAQFKRGPDAYRIKMNNEWIGDFDLEKDFTNMANGNWVIGNVYLREAHQGKGLGKESFIQANNLLKSQGKGELHSSGYFYGPSAKYVWESLVKEGKAEKIGKDAWRFKSTDLPGSPNASTITEPFEIAKRRIVNSSDNINRIIRKPEPVAKPNYGQQEFAFPTDAPISSARLSNEEQMIEGMERARLAKNEEGTALNPSVGVDKPRVIKSPDYYLDIMKMNKYNGKNKQYFIDLVESVKKQGNVASERQYDELQRILSGDYTRDKRGYAEVPTKLPGSPNAYDDVQKAGFLNPLAIADRIIPRLPYPSWYLGQQGSWNNISPLNIIPGYGKKLSNTAGQYPVGFRKFGNTLDDVKSSKTLRPKGGFRKGADQMAREGNWAEPGKVNENYVGVFEATMDPNIEGSNIKLTKKPNRYGIVGTTKEGDVAIPLTDAGLSFNRRLPFSNKYVPINKQKLLDNKFQLATQLPHVQSLIEKYGIAAGQALVFGYILGGKKLAEENLKTINKYSIDPVINWSKKEWDNLKKMTTDKKEGGPIEMDLTEDEVNAYKEGGWVVEYVD